MLDPAWEYVPAPGWLIDFDGIQDPAGNIYWVEELGDTPQPTRWAIASASSSGQLRWRIEPTPSPGYVWAWLYADGRLVIGLESPTTTSLYYPTFHVPDQVVALDASSGATRWNVNLAPAFASLVPASDGPSRPDTWVGQPSATTSTVTLPIGAGGASGYVWGGLVRVDLETGGILDLRATAAALSGWIPGDPVATAGTTFASVRPTVQSAALLGIAASGDLRLATPLAYQDGPWIMAVSDQYLFEASAQVDTPAFAQWMALDGTPLGRARWIWWRPTDDVLSSGGTALLISQGRVARLELDRCAVAWQATLGRAGPDLVGGSFWLAETTPFLTRRGGLLVSVQVGDSPRNTSPQAPSDPAFVVELAPDGSEVFRAMLPTGFIYAGGAALYRGRWITARGPSPAEQHLVAFDLAGQDVAEHGWTTHNGSPARDRAAR
jgi:hypothetical protein